jgi:hypothetical protein
MANEPFFAKGVAPPFQNEGILRKHVRFDTPNKNRIEIPYDFDNKPMPPTEKLLQSNRACILNHNTPPKPCTDLELSLLDSENDVFNHKPFKLIDQLKNCENETPYNFFPSKTPFIDPQKISQFSRGT